MQYTISILPSNERTNGRTNGRTNEQPNERMHTVGTPGDYVVVVDADVADEEMSVMRVVVEPAGVWGELPVDGDTRPVYDARRLAALQRVYVGQLLAVAAAVRVPLDGKAGSADCSRRQRGEQWCIQGLF